MNPSNINHISDFPDKLNPMLVKELRQGLRGISFVILFISLQAFLCFILLITATATADENAGNLLSRIIFFFFSFAVLLIQPLRGISALTTEISGNTIDLLSLTSLSAWRITFGKWISIVSQSALILTAIFPYLILRYFFGDMQMFAELLLLLTTFILSATLTAITVGFSGMKSSIIRVVLPVFGAIIGFSLLSQQYFGGRHNYQQVLQLVTLNDTASTFTFLGFILLCIYTTWISLDLGTSAIAPMAENRATLRRIVSLSLITFTLLAFSFADVDVTKTITIGLALCIPVSIISLTENPRLIPPIVTPFLRKGLLGKIAGKLLYPGWTTGLLFVLLLYLLMHTFLTFFQHRGDTVSDSHKIALNSVFAILFFAIALTRIFVRKSENRIGIFILFTCIQFLFTSLIYAAEKWANDLHIMKYFFWIPTSILYLAGSRALSESTLLNASYFNLVLYAAIALATTLPIWKHIREIEQQSLSA